MKPSLDPDTVRAIRPTLAAVAEEIATAIQNEIPDYAEAMRGEFGRVSRLSIEKALRLFIAAREERAESQDFDRRLGAIEHRAGRSLEAIQACYRLGARIAWRRFSRTAVEAGVTVEAQHDLAEAIFTYIEGLAARTVEGYAEAEAAASGVLQQRRVRLLASLFAAGPLDESALAAASRDARWRLPRQLAVIATGAGEAPRIAQKLTGDVLYGSVPGGGYVVVPEPDDLEAQVAAIADRYRTTLALGPTVALDEAARSLRWATLARTIPAAPGVAVVALEHLPALLLAASAEIVNELRAQMLAPLTGENAASRRRLEETLAAWLRQRGAQAMIAAELGVHPQTVRYRLGRLRGLMGERLEDPDARFALEIALRGPA